MAAIAGLLIVAGCALYLILFGLAALVAPDRAHRFVAAFGQTARANWAEAIARILAGLGFSLAVPQLPGPSALWSAFAAVLVVSAVWMVLWPAAHAKVARRSVAAVRPWLRLLGAFALVFGLLLVTITGVALERTA